MKRNVFDKVQLNEIFKRECVLYADFVPDKLPFRENEIDELVFCLKPLAFGRKPLHVSVVGSTGIGKTVTVKYVLDQLQEFTEKAKSLYLNCYEFNTRNAIFFAILNKLGRIVPRRGLASDELYSMLLEEFGKTDFVPVIVLDEFDQLLKKEDGQKLLYDLLRLPEQREKAKLSLIVLSNDFEIMAKLDDRIKSSFSSHEIIFENYTPQQLKEILNERAKIAFQENVLDKDVINVAAAHAGKQGGDCRIAIESLLKAGRIAEKQNAKKVTLEHLKQAFQEVQQTNAKKALPHLKEEEKLLLKILLSGELVSLKLFKEFNKKSSKKVSDRMLRNYLKELEKKQLIESKKSSQGLAQTISLKINKQYLEEILN